MNDKRDPTAPEDGGAVLPRYRSHKIVEAFLIAEILAQDDGSAVLNNDDGTLSVDVFAEYIAKHEPQVGGYYVRYPDGYESFSPAAAFEDGYTPRNLGAPPDADERAEFPRQLVTVRCGRDSQDLGLIMQAFDGGCETRLMQPRTNYRRELGAGDHLTVLPLQGRDLEAFRRLQNIEPNNGVERETAKAADIVANPGIE